MERTEQVGGLLTIIFVELPVAEAYAPLYASVERTGIVLLAALISGFGHSERPAVHRDRGEEPAA